MYSSMVVVRGNPGKKVLEHKYSDVGELAGMKFIRLRHIRGFGMPGSDGDGVHGFQAAQVFIRTDGNRVTYDWKPDQDEEAKPIVGRRQLVFRADAETGEFFAMLPDTAENRRILACCYNNNAQWTICDKGIDAEIKVKAEEEDAKIPRGRTKDEIIRDQAELLQRFQQKEELERREKDRLARLGKEAKDVIEPPAAPTIDVSIGEAGTAEAEADPSAEDDDPGATRWPNGKVKLGDTGLMEKAKEAVINGTMKDFCDKLKKDYGEDKWFKCYAYTAKVQKAITKKFNELRAQNVNDSANRDSDQGRVPSRPE
jgi:hypothetical protein